jgi:formylglycine-generating enzyme required for sulfatase activity
MSEAMQNVRVPNGCEAIVDVAEPYTHSGWAKEIMHKKTGIVLVYVPAGKFKMGTKPGDEFAKHEIQHQVTLTKGFYMGKYPVTMTQFMKVYPKHKFAYMDIKGEPEPINGMVPADHVK